VKLTLDTLLVHFRCDTYGDKYLEPVWCVTVRGYFLKCFSFRNALK